MQYEAGSSSAVERVLDFAERIFRRADGPDEVVPKEHQPNWLDRPSRWRLYPGMPRIPLHSPADLHRGYSRLLPENTQAEKRVPTLEDLALALYLMAGPLKRKVDINWNADPPLIAFARQEYTRGSASGGGLYPVQLYLVAGAGREPGAGVYHYSNLEHALVPMRHGNWADSLAHAVSSASQPPYAYYVVVAIDFWMSCFKYHNFGYHVCCEDTGTMLATLHLVCDALGIDHRSLLAFEDRGANEVIGADGHRESVFAVVGVGGKSHPAAAVSRPAGVALPVPKPWQRSLGVNIPETLANIHTLTMVDGREAGALIAAAESARTGFEAGRRRPLDSQVSTGLPSILMSRKSAWSSMRGPAAIQLEQLVELLRFVWRHSQSSTNAPRETLPPGVLEIGLRVNDVVGMERGLYRWVPTADGLGSLQPASGEYLDLWQATYSMTNYNIDEVACTLFLIGNLRSAIEQYGARGYRILNAHVGIAAQLAYVAAAALQLDCGAVLGVRAQRVKQALELDPDQNVFLAIYLSQAQKRVELFSFNLLPDVQPCKPSL